MNSRAVALVSCAGPKCTVVKQTLPKAMFKNILRRFMNEIRLYARLDHLRRLNHAHHEEKDGRQKNRGSATARSREVKFVLH
ncbi:unnamed protein product [Peronospora belbahrii]|uniref:Uncharacterized protein n=1 Tax=Peronospora belbahrii TaxID=622444 RepID=A0AAU9LDA1_9STRA|nr:unnamed protein product [Peronospora belbahrii]